MASSTTDRRLGLTGGTAMKAPCAVSTTANITLSGEQTIDGVLTADSRVLVMNQTDQTENGIYVSDSGSWERDLDFDGNLDVVTGTMVFVINGTAGGNKFYQVTTTGTITIGTSNIAFSAVTVAFSGLTANSVATSNIQANAVTYAKIQQASAGNVVLGNATSSAANFAEIAISQSTLLGRGSTGNIAAISVGSGLSMSGTTLSASTSIVASQFRGTLTTAVPVTTGDVTAATTVYLSPYTGNALVINGTSYTASELSLALDSNSGHTGYHQADKNFDVYAYVVSGTTVGIGTGPAWTSDTSRGTGAGTTELQRTNGVLNNKNTITLRIGTASGDTTSVTAGNATYMFSFRATSNGQTEDSFAKRFVWNAYNRSPRAMKVVDTTDSWNYTTATFRQANAATANQLDYLVGLSEDPVEAVVRYTALNGTAGVAVRAGIGVDSTSANSATLYDALETQVTNVRISFGASYRGYPGLGRHTLVWLEFSVASGTTTWYGDNGSGTVGQSGIYGVVFG